MKIDIKNVLGFVEKTELNQLQDKINIYHQELLNKTGNGSDYVGWVKLPSTIDSALINKIQSEAERIRKKAEVFVVIGIGGSYLGARAVIEALSSSFQSFKTGLNNPFIVFAGNNLSEDYHNELLALLDKKEYAVAVISKSGTTTEPAIAFRIIKNHL